jgi:hypothetical protein
MGVYLVQYGASGECAGVIGVGADLDSAKSIAAEHNAASGHNLAWTPEGEHRWIARDPMDWGSEYTIKWMTVQQLVPR